MTDLTKMLVCEVSFDKTIPPIPVLIRQGHWADFQPTYMAEGPDGSLHLRSRVQSPIRRGAHRRMPPPTPPNSPVEDRASGKAPRVSHK